MKKISIAGSLCLLFAIFIFAISFFTDKKMKSLVSEIEQNMVEVEGDKILPENEGKLVLVKGRIESGKESLKDPLFGTTIHTIKMTRVVEVYQWQETEHVTTTNTGYNNRRERKYHYTYKEGWFRKIIKSNSFHVGGHVNPSQKAIEDEVFVGKAFLGDYELSKHFINELKADTPFDKLSEETARSHGMNIFRYYYTTSKPQSLTKIGDIRVSFGYIDENKLPLVTILARQTGNTFDTYIAQNGRSLNEFWFETLDKEKVIAKFAEDAASSKSCSLVMSVIFAIIGVLVILFEMGMAMMPKK